MPSRSKTPSNSGKPPKPLVMSNSQGKSSVNLISASGHITSPSATSVKLDQSVSDNTHKHTENSKGPDRPSSTKLPTADSTGLTDDPLSKAVEELDDALRPFLQPDWETNKSYQLTKLKYYHIMFHFNPQTSARPTHSKEILTKKFKKELLPKLTRFCITEPPATPTMQVDDKDDTPDFNPLSRRTTVKMLTDTIHAKYPKVNVSPVALKDQVLVLYKHYVDRELRLPQTSNFNQKPKAVPSKSVGSLSMAELRLAIHTYAPHIFLNYPVLRHPNLVSIYRVFIHEEDQFPEEETLVEGYHYWIIAELVSSEV